MKQSILYANHLYDAGYRDLDQIPKCEQEFLSSLIIEDSAIKDLPYANDLDNDNELIDLLAAYIKNKSEINAEKTLNYLTKNLVKLYLRDMQMLMDEQQANDPIEIREREIYQREQELDRYSGRV